MNFVLFPDEYVVSLILNLFVFVIFFLFYFPTVITMGISYLFTHLCRPFSLRCHPRQSRRPPRRRGPPSIPGGSDQSGTSPSLP